MSPPSCLCNYLLIYFWLFSIFLPNSFGLIFYLFIFFIIDF
jgi:hypothetical protein